MDPSGLMDQDSDLRDNIKSVELLAPERVTLHSRNALEKDFLQFQDLILISLESWKQAVESHSIWLSNSPSVLIIRA